MSGLVLQGFSPAGSIAQIIRDGLGASEGLPPISPPISTQPPTATISANYWQHLKGPNLDRMLREQAIDREFGESIRADYRKTVLGIDPVRDEIAALEAIAAEPLPEYKGPAYQRPNIRVPNAPVAARAVATVAAPAAMNLSKYGAALAVRNKPSRFSK